MLRCTGKVVRYEKKSWAVNGNSGVSRTARVQTSAADWVDVSIPEDAPFPEPREDDIVDWGVLPSVSGGRDGGSARSRIAAKCEWGSLRDTPEVPAQREGRRAAAPAGV